MTSSMWDPVPWMIGGGAEHSTEVARNLAFAAFRGREGIVSPTDLFVRAKAVPSGHVEVFPGTAAVLNRSAGSRDEMYVARMPVLETVPIAPTGATARTDLIVARIENPHLPGESWPAPTDPRFGPYVSTAVISGVPSTTTSVKQLGLGYSALPLARVTIPPSTGAITSAMVTDLRFMSNSAAERALRVQVIPNPVSIPHNSTMTPVPGGQEVTIPEWATHFRSLINISGVEFNNGANQTDLSGMFSGEMIDVAAPASRLDVGSTVYDVSVPAGAAGGRFTFAMGRATNTVPASFRGRTMSCTLSASRNSGHPSATMTFIGGSASITFDIEFYTAPTPA